MIGLSADLVVREAEGRPVRIGLVGAGQMGTDVVAEAQMMKGVEVVITADIDLTRARSAYSIARVDAEVVEASAAAEADEAVTAGRRVYTSDYRVVAEMATVDVLLEATGVPEVGSRAALHAVRAGKHLAMMNVETDITVGPLLRWYAEQKGVLYALAAGDEPAACKELYDFADALGLRSLRLAGKNNPLDRQAD